MSAARAREGGGGDTVVARRVLIVDDLLATGGTALATARLVQRAGGKLAGARFIVELPDLGGVDALATAGIDAKSLFQFEGH